MDGDSVRLASGLGVFALVAIAAGSYLAASKQSQPYVPGSGRTQLALVHSADDSATATSAKTNKPAGPTAVPPPALSSAAGSARAALGQSPSPTGTDEGHDLSALLERARSAVTGAAALATSPPNEAASRPTPDAGAPAAEADEAPDDAGTLEPATGDPAESEPKDSEPRDGESANETPPVQPQEPVPDAPQSPQALVAAPSVTAANEQLPPGVGDPLLGVRNVPTYTPSRSARSRGAFALVGKPAKELQIAQWTRGDRPPISVEASRGKVLVVYAFQGWCPGCQKRGFPVTKQLEQIYALRPDVEFIYVQSPFEGHFVNDFERLEREQFNWNINRPMAQDSVNDGGRPSLMRAYRSGGTPWHIIIDKGGVIRFNDFTRSAQAFQVLINSLL